MSWLPGYVRVFDQKTTAPTTSEDENSGYQVGDLWLDEVGDAAYMCLDASAGAAVWNYAGSSDLALGETSTTAYRGDRGKTAYDHSQGNGSDHADVATNSAARHAQGTDQRLDGGGANEVTAAQAKTAYTHSQTTSGNPHSVSASDIGVEDGATADQTGAEIKSLYEAETNTNAFTDAEKTLLANQSGVNTGDQDLSGYASLALIVALGG